MDTVSQRVCPKFDNTDCLKAMMKSSYGLTVTCLTSLNGYEDCNYHIRADDDYNNDHIQEISPHGYLLKIVNSIDSKNPDFVLGQKLLMDALSAAGVKCQEEVKTVNGDFFSKLTNSENGDPVNYIVSVRIYIPGVILNTVNLTKSLCFQVGKLVADVSKALKKFHFEFYDNFTPIWNMDNFMPVKNVLHAVKDEKRREIAEQVFQMFESKVTPRKDEFRKGQIHGDINEQNILVEESEDGHRVCGLLDFQDAAYSYCVYDVAIGIAYLMMVHDSDVPMMDVGGHLLAGYLSVFSLNQAEKDALRNITASRMVMSLVYGAYFYTLDPSNEYVLTTEKVGWEQLAKFWNTPEETLWMRWNDIVKSYDENAETVEQTIVVTESLRTCIIQKS